MSGIDLPPINLDHRKITGTAHVRQLQFVFLDLLVSKNSFISQE